MAKLNIKKIESAITDLAAAIFDAAYTGNKDAALRLLTQWAEQPKAIAFSIALSAANGDVVAMVGVTDKGDRVRRYMVGRGGAITAHAA